MKRLESLAGRLADIQSKKLDAAQLYYRQCLANRNELAGQYEMLCQQRETLHTQISMVGRGTDVLQVWMLIQSLDRELGQVHAALLYADELVQGAKSQVAMLHVEEERWNNVQEQQQAIRQEQEWRTETTELDEWAVIAFGRGGS